MLRRKKSDNIYSISTIISGQIVNPKISLENQMMQYLLLVIITKYLIYIVIIIISVYVTLPTILIYIINIYIKKFRISSDMTTNYYRFYSWEH